MLRKGTVSTRASRSSPQVARVYGFQCLLELTIIRQRRGDWFLS